MLLAEEYNLGLCLSHVHRRHSDSVLLLDTDRTLIYTWKCFAAFSCLRLASLPSVDSAAILLLSSPVAEQYLTGEDGPLSPPGFRQQSSVAEHFLAVEDGFTSLPSILSQSSVHEQRQSVDAGPLSPLSIHQQSCY